MSSCRPFVGLTPHSGKFPHLSTTKRAAQALDVLSKEIARGTPRKRGSAPDCYRRSGFAVSLFKSVSRRFLVLSVAAVGVLASAALYAQDMKVMRIGAGPTGATDFP